MWGVEKIPAILIPFKWKQYYLSNTIYTEGLNILKNREGVFLVIEGENSTQYLDAAINKYISDLTKATDKIVMLYKKSNEILQSINDEMQTRASSKLMMTNEQITYFKRFSLFNEEALKKVKSNLLEINKLRQMTDIQIELLQENTNYKNVADELRNISSIQNDTVTLLTEIIDYGRTTLEEICHNIAN